MLKLLKIIATTLVSLIIIIHLILLSYGVASFLTLPIVYILFTYCIDRIVAKLYPEWIKSGGRISFLTLMVCLLAAEFFLKYGSGKYLNHQEKNGGLIYSSPYTANKIEYTIRKYVKHEEKIITYLNTPNEINVLKTKEFSYEHRYNDMGLRDRSYSKEELSHRHVIMAMGDSFTEGVGTPADSTWIKLLGDHFTIDTASPLFINAGAAGSDVFYEYWKLKMRLEEQYHPSLVILAINSSDIDDVIYRGGMERFVSDYELRFPSPPWWDYLYSFSFVTRHIVHDAIGYNRMLCTDEEYQKRTEAAKKKIEDCLLRYFAPYIIQQRGKLVVVFSPEKFEISSGLKPMEACMADLQRHNMTVVDLYPPFQERKAQLDKLFWQIDGHNNSHGYKLWSDVIASQTDSIIRNL